MRCSMTAHQCLYLIVQPFLPGNPTPLTFVRTPENARHVAANAQVLLLGQLDDVGVPLETLLDAAADVLLREQLRRRSEDGDLLYA